MKELSSSLNHNYPHIGILRPFPSFHLYPSLMIILDNNILRQVKDRLCLRDAPIKSPLEKYLALKTRDDKAFGKKIKLHPCLYNMVKLKKNKF